MPTYIAPDNEVAGSSLILIVRAVKSFLTYSKFTSTSGTDTNYRVHVDRTVIFENENSGECLPFFCSEAVKKNLMFLKQGSYLLVGHLPVADDAVYEEPAGRFFTGIVLAAETLAGLYYVTSAYRTAADDFLFNFQSDISNWFCSCLIIG